MSSLGDNIKKLRLFHGETQKDLADYLHCSDRTISAYEKGSNEPDLLTLQKIAERYERPLDELIRADLSTLNRRSATLNWQKLVEIIDIVLPLVTSEEAMQNQDFLNAFRIVKDIISKIKKNGTTIRSERLSQAYDLFVKAFENEITVESSANLIALVILWWSLLPDEQNAAIGYILSVHPISVARYTKIKSENKTSSVNENNKISFLNGVIPLIDECSKIVIESTKYPGFAEYYYSFRYIIGMVSTGYSCEMNRTIGVEMMLAQLTFGNHYAFNYIDASMKY